MPAPSDPPARTGGDRCPGAVRLHPADDGALARVRLPGGLLTNRQAEALARLSDELGDGHLDLTSRGNVQLRGLPEACGGELGSRLHEAGLLPSERHDRVRNVAASPLCGLDGPAPADVQAWSRALDQLLCANPDITKLSGRFLFGLDDGRGDIAALAPDVTLIATDDGHALLSYAATGSCLRIPAAHAPRAAVLAAEWFLDERRRTGSTAWRIAELPAGQRPRLDVLGQRLTAEGIAAEPAQSAPQPGVPTAPGLVPGPGGRTALSVTAPLGRLSTGQWRQLYETAIAGTGELRVTPWRGVVVPGLPADAAPARLAALAEAGLVTSADSAWHRAGACAGRPGCAKSLADVRADAAACLARSAPGQPLPVYWSGCERRCGRPGGGRWVDVLATGDGYRIAIRDNTTETARVTVPAADLAGAVATARTTTR
ncbi:precorrin-3B synthase [Streptoverticillium reticulum]|uniref:precorrin-3B synthase n=1 Tax=Streptoverticillium reticulum TaxID=1433415 RepID=UPI0039BF35F4